MDSDKKKLLMHKYDISTAKDLSRVYSRWLKSKEKENLRLFEEFLRLVYGLWKGDNGRKKQYGSFSEYFIHILKPSRPLFRKCIVIHDNEDDLILLRKRLIAYKKEQSSEEFDEWLFGKTKKKDIYSTSSGMISALFTELERLQVEFINKCAAKKTNKSQATRNNMYKIKISDEFLDKMIARIDESLSLMRLARLRRARRDAR
jgi:hypothetical protein